MSEVQARRTSRQASGLQDRALLLKRFDFRESSRVLTFATREHGIVNALAKGAHRADSPFLGRLDFLNELVIRLSPDRGGLRLLLHAELQEERRSLRQPRRFLAASHLAAICQPTMGVERGEPTLFDLLSGGLTLISRCPAAALPVVTLGLELRLLAHEGSLPDLDHCGECGQELQDRAFHGEVQGSLVCRDHAPAPRRAIGADTLALLRTLRDRPGRSWPGLARRPPPAVARDLALTWLQTSLDLRPRLRSGVFALPAAGS